MGWKHFNDRLAIILIVLIVVLWILQGRGIISAIPEVTGATITVFSLITQYYFRKAPADSGTPPTTSTPPAPSTPPKTTPPGGP